ncbi:hypothetical protein ACGLFO_06450, partial [Corynebacterium hesseae]
MCLLLQRRGQAHDVVHVAAQQAALVPLLEGELVADAFVQGLGMLLRQTAGTVAISLILYLGLENIVRVLPTVGDKAIHFMPFTAFQNWAVNYVDENAPWSSVGFEALVFFGWAAVLWIFGVIVLEQRDA